MIQVDTERHKVFSNGREYRFGPREFALLKMLSESNGKVMSREQIMAKLNGNGGRRCHMRNVDQHIARIRRIIGKNAIRTVVNSGYSADGIEVVNSGKKYGAIESINDGFILVRVDSVEGLKVGGAVRVA